MTWRFAWALPSYWPWVLPWVLDSSAEKQKQNAQGNRCSGCGCSWWVLPGFGKLAKSNMLRVGGRGSAFMLRDFSQQLSVSSSRPPPAPPPFALTCPSRSSIPLTQFPPSLPSKPPPSLRLGVFVYESRVMSFYLSSSYSCSLRLSCCCTAVLVAPSQPNAYKRKRWYARLPLRYVEWSAASSTFLAITAVLTVTRREFARSLVFIFSKYR